MLAGVEAPPPPLGASTAMVAFEIGAEKIYHIPDDKGRRLIEGWASLGGIDWQDEEILPESFEQGAKEYLSKNPVLIWDHKRHIPIGKVLELSVTDEGLFMRAELFAPTNEEIKELGSLNNLSEGYESYLLKANEVWWGIKQGLIRGLSVQGRTRRRAVWSQELGRYIHQGIQTLIYEISVTPTQVHPGSRITGVNTLAKALEISKALPLQTKRKTMNEKQKKAIEQAQKAYLDALQAAGDGAEIPEELAENHQLIAKAISFEEATEEEAAPSQKEVSEEVPNIEALIMKAIAPLQEQINGLKGQPAPLRGKTAVKAPEGAQAKPVSVPKKGGIFEKALGIIAKSKNGISDFGTGEVHGCDAIDAMKIVFAKSVANHGRVAIQSVTAPAHLQGMSVSDSLQKLLNNCMFQ